MTTPAISAPSALGIRSWSDVRALIHVIAPLLATIAVAKGWADQNVAALGVTLILAVLSPVLATVNTANGFRRWFYPVFAAVTAILIALGYITDGDVALWLPLITVFIGPAVAIANTPTTIDGEVIEVTDTEHGQATPGVNETISDTTKQTSSGFGLGAADVDDTGRHRSED